MMRAIGIVLALMVMAVESAGAQQPIVRAQLVPSGHVTVGEPVELRVDILVPTWLLGAPQFPMLDVEGAIVTGPGRTLNLTERRGGDTWSGVQRAYTIVAVGPGPIEVPAVTIPIRYSGEGAKPVDGSVTTRPLQFEATVPPEARGLPYFIASTRLTLTQRLEPRADTLKVGDALKRTITTAANDAQAMLLPPLPTGPIDGLGVYPEAPVVRDEGGERGSQRTGRRVDAVTYVMELEGDYVLPAFEVVWWDVRAKRVRRGSVDAVGIVVIPNPDAIAELPIPVEDDSLESTAAAEPLDLRFLWWLVPALAALAWIVQWFARLPVPRIAAWWRERERVRRESEPAYFAGVKEACRSADPHAAMRAIHAWLIPISASGRLELLETLAAESQDAGLASAVKQLYARLYGRDAHKAGAWNGEELLQGLLRYRGKRLQREGTAASELPALNPQPSSSALQAPARRVVLEPRSTGPQGGE